MKNLLESLAILIVGLLTVAIIYWIVQYNMIAGGNMVEEIEYEVAEKQVSQKEKATDYLENLEGYEDVDVEVDATKETHTNTVVVKSELNNDELDAAVEEAKPSADTASDPEAPAEEISDEIGMAIDAALDDL